ncbi:DgyrCDS6133 [Dimorphilus gyrociliatus]|uniref:DgyrCDS6133 n=1 Tax=Dimorphilus gyrociliatus TaxID=2664684 RepID=A0A7I8VPF5_9ANNE|nr:DgyrCDS6133 [Dimorphilus gyrociliatus]
MQLRKVTASQFIDVWSHYDVDGNGFIEGNELDAFLKEFMVNTQPFDETSFQYMKGRFLDAFDENDDDRIDISEMAQILPTEENFLLLFRFKNPLTSSVEFMRVWREFDKDCSGYIEADELKDFLEDLLKEANREDQVTEEQLLEYTTTMLQLFDQNKDGKLQLSEMAKLLPVKENFLCRPIFKMSNVSKKLNASDIDSVFNLYDTDSNGCIENEELNGFLKDLMELVQSEYDSDDIQYMKKTILDQWDFDKDGKINKNELTMLLLQQSQTYDD